MVSAYTAAPPAAWVKVRARDRVRVRVRFRVRVMVRFGVRVTDDAYRWATRRAGSG